MKKEKEESKSDNESLSDEDEDSIAVKEKKGKKKAEARSGKKADLEKGSKLKSIGKNRHEKAPEKRDEKKKKEEQKKVKKKEEIKEDKKKKKLPGSISDKRRRLIKHGMKYELDKARAASDEVAIDWETDEGSFETTADKKKLRIIALESELNDIKRENMNLLNEIAHMRPDLDKKTEMIGKYDERMEKFKDDFDRIKMRNLKEKSKSMRYASEKLALNLLEVLDNMDRAIKETRPDGDVRDVINAVKQMNKQMKVALEKEGIKPIETNKKPFDPTYHEAIVSEDDDTIPDNTIIDEFQKGYMYKDKILRVSRVKVSKTDKIPAVKIKKEKPKKKEAEKPEKKKEVREERQMGKEKLKEKQKLRKEPTKDEKMQKKKKGSPEIKKEKPGKHVKDDIKRSSKKKK